MVGITGMGWNEQAFGLGQTAGVEEEIRGAGSRVRSEGGEKWTGIHGVKSDQGEDGGGDSLWKGITRM